MILLDSNHFSILLDDRDPRSHSLRIRLIEVMDEVQLPIVVVEESMRGWLALIHKARLVRDQIEPYRQLAKFVKFLSEWEIVSWTDACATLFEDLRRAKVRIGTYDLKIASLALANDALLLSANLRDFQQVPGLHVEDWLESP